jgi:hypothetical protein
VAIKEDVNRLAGWPEAGEPCCTAGWQPVLDVQVDMSRALAFNLVSTGSGYTWRIEDFTRPRIGGFTR